ncbi:MAG: RidA family protein [Burkholderiales bacterium]|nr:RidA family protein [Burkholderiales bacterium]
MSTGVEIPPPRGKFSRVKTVSVANAKFIYLSGMTAGGEAPYDVAEQTGIIFRRMDQLLREHGASLRDLMKITAFLADIREYDRYNEVRNRIFGEFPEPSASTSVGITLLAPAIRVEIEGVAVVTEQR